MFAFPNYRETVNIYDAFDLDYSAGDRLKMFSACAINPCPTMIFYRTDDTEDAHYGDLTSCSLEAGSIVEYRKGGQIYKMFITSIDPGLWCPPQWADNGCSQELQVYYANVICIQGKECNYPDGICDDCCNERNAHCYKFQSNDIAYTHLVYGKDVYVKDANGEITDIDGAKLIEAILLQVDTNASVIKLLPAASW